ncbi:MAG: hypothetical protein JSS30_05720 [Verrucomicrobia bacterium]|nr:hypothetical protein [Verrucomicrobiota bacterium]
MEENLDPISPILPIDFFNTQIDLHEVEKGELKKKHLLPDFSDLLAEDHFADVSMGWEQKGLHFAIEVHYPFAEGDGVELFIDTRDLKTAGFVTRFCHHFLIEGTTAQEITTFRTDDKHELCNSSLIEVKGNFPKKNYSLHIFIPAECLHGYDPTSFDRLGFAYRINRDEGNRQHFSLSSDYFAIEKEPSLWSSLLFK